MYSLVHHLEGYLLSSQLVCETSKWYLLEGQHKGILLNPFPIQECVLGTVFVFSCMCLDFNESRCSKIKPNLWTQVKMNIIFYCAMQQIQFRKQQYVRITSLRILIPSNEGWNVAHSSLFSRKTYKLKMRNSQKNFMLKIRFVDSCEDGENHTPFHYLLKSRAREPQTGNEHTLPPCLCC